MRKATNNWFLNLNGSRIGCLSKKVSNYLSTKTNGHTAIDGFRVSNIYKWTLEDTQNFDLKNSTNFETSWTVYGSNWTETSLMLAFIEIPGMCVVPDKVLTASFDQIRVKVTNEKGLIEIEMVNLTT